MAPAPTQGPSSRPTTSTPKGCMVMGTGVHGSGTATCAQRATKSEPSTMPTARPRVVLSAAARLEAGCAAICTEEAEGDKLVF